MPRPTEIRHAGLIAIRLSGAWVGAAIEGPSGSGKSDLALRALAEGFRLVADDRLIVFSAAGRLFGRAPPALSGLIELRGLGVRTETALPFAEVAVTVRCKTSSRHIDRMPEGQVEIVQGIEIPTLDLDPFELSAPAKIRRALDHLGGGRGRAYQACCAPEA